LEVVNAVEARISLGDGMNQTATIRPRGYPPSAVSFCDSGDSIFFDLRHPPLELVMFTACEMAQIPRQQKLVLKLADPARL
jgi:hypothetical protein